MRLTQFPGDYAAHPPTPTEQAAIQLLIELAAEGSDRASAYAYQIAIAFPVERERRAARASAAK